MPIASEIWTWEEGNRLYSRLTTNVPSSKFIARLVALDLLKFAETIHAYFGDRVDGGSGDSVEGIRALESPEETDPHMSDSILKLIAAQRLLAELHELLEAEALAVSLRSQAELRAEALTPTYPANAHRVDRLECLIAANRKFGTVYADPPWPYDNTTSRGAAENHYRAMRVDAIAELPIAKLADQAHLHLWTTNGFLFEARQVIEAWGFSYKSCLLWIKPQLGNGNYWRVSHEFLLLGVRGTLTLSDKTQQSWLYAERTQHSAKPRVFRKLIERVSPGPRLELFARVPVEDWTVWGDEAQPDLFSTNCSDEPASPLRWQSETP